MAKLVWDEVGKRFYETGVRNGVLYVQDTSGEYPLGVAWNGLVSVTESPSGAEASPMYADDIKYLNLISTEEFGARFFSQGGMPSGIVTIEKFLNQDQRNIARENLQQLMSGLGNAHKFALFEGGMKPEPWASMPLEDIVHCHIAAAARCGNCSLNIARARRS